MAAILAATVALPLIGAWLVERDLRELMRFPPPLQVPAAYPRWSWVAFIFVTGTLAAVAGSFGVATFRQRRARPSRQSAESGAAQPFPRWGWAAVAWTFAWWLLAWTRFPWFADAQRFTFFPLWLGFVVTVNALTWRRAGTCAMLRSPARWVTLFGASAGFWWVFEWLNRFVRNWHYLGVEDFGAPAYALNASLCFSTVLPAVLAVREWLGTSVTFDSVSAGGPRWRWLRRRRTGAALICGGAAALALAGARPEEFYAALWIAPLALAFGAGILTGRDGLWSELARGDWRRTAAWAMAALICGVFWEMWNLFSAAKWIYSVPYVERWHLFEMPLLGYAGYFGFGLECRLVVERVLGSSESARRSNDEGLRVPAR